MISQSNQKLGVFLLLAGLLSGGAAAQGMFKCKDAAGKITYSGKECGLIGQRDAGEVTGRAVVAPAFKPPAPKPPPSAAPPEKASAAASQNTAKKEPEPVAPERRCFTVKTAKGTTTRCNDKPPEDEPAGK